ncbi:MAG TPA: hypothetical protein VFW94_09550, partial [Candidatus Acidoferrales bacterium]|nr:hypothetical protein [Candidatus Acidoferrales bacterium]
IPDAKGRVGHHPNRVEAESMKLDGYVVTDVTPWETASGSKAIICPDPSKTCSATFNFRRRKGKYDLEVEYFDQNNGQSHFRLLVNGKQIDAWVANGDYPSMKPDGNTSTRRIIRNVALRSGDEIRIEGVPDAGERAPLDYIRIVPAQ